MNLFSMGRSRGVPFCGVDDPTTQKSKRKRATSSIENIESVTAGQGLSDGKKALYHCNYCNKDISGKIRIKYLNVLCVQISTSVLSAFLWVLRCILTKAIIHIGLWIIYHSH